MPRPLARWNSVRDVWEEEATGLFCEHSDAYSETWPTSGMTRGGMAFELPTWEERMGASVSLSWPLPPTPQAQDERHSVTNASNRLEQGRQMQLVHVVGMLTQE